MTSPFFMSSILKQLLFLKLINCINIPFLKYLSAIYLYVKSSLSMPRFGHFSTDLDLNDIIHFAEAWGYDSFL